VTLRENRVCPRRSVARRREPAFDDCHTTSVTNYAASVDLDQSIDLPTGPKVVSIRTREQCFGAGSGLYFRTDRRMHDFDHIAKRLWFMDHAAARLVATLSEKDRHSIELCLLTLYGVSIHLTGGESDIKAAVEKVRRV
jgi:hypothetical protein